MAYRKSAACFVGSLLLGGMGACFDPGVSSSGTEGDTEGSSGTVATTASMTSMTMTTMDPMTDTSMTTLVDDTSDDGPPPECTNDEDCTAPANECETAACSAEGTCVTDNAPEGTACGDQTADDCNAADTCDGSGTCRSNEVADGMDCEACDAPPCVCTGGACGGCVTFADTNLFTTERSLIGWELTGDWRLYTEAPPSQGGLGMPSPPIPFGNSVLGTDGNRRQPYPSNQAERSYARTPPTELPASITFQSWHLDEGAGNFDNKIIRISTDDGATWQDIISCPLNPELPFCQPVSEREADDWDAISLDLPAPLVGEIGIVEFAYDSGDNQLGFEKGWFIDVINFATECACTSDAICAPYGGECGAGVCGANGGCNLDAVAEGTACGDASDIECSMPDTCDGNGFCHPRDRPNLMSCGDCEAGQDCIGCELGVCADCPDDVPVATFDSVPFAGVLEGWTFNNVAGGGWFVTGSINQNEDGDPVLLPDDAPMLGNDGSSAFPYGDGMGEVSTAQIMTRPDVVPATLTFSSWNQDEGGTGGADVKRIDLSVDGGVNWIPLADCLGAEVLSDFAFCEYVVDRMANDWDAIEIDTSEWQGMLGVLRFGYDTADSCCGFERGWYVDDLSFAQACPTPNLSHQLTCEYLPEPLCDDDLFCAWDAGASACISCVFLSEPECNATPGCVWEGGAFNSCFGAQE